MKILSIDGGGIKGLFSAAFLAGLEKRYGRQIADYFDLIAGTSTGGILALALAARLPAENIVEFYKKWGPKIFPTRLGFFFNLRSYLLAKYKNGVLIQALKDVFKELRIEDIYKDKRIALCIPSIDAISGSPWVFKTAHDSRLIRDNAYFLWEVALATSAAPTYFPLAKVKKPDSTASNLFVDGGLWANNPTLVALTEALTYGKSKIEDVSILSVGNIRTSTTFRSTTLKQRSPFVEAKGCQFNFGNSINCCSQSS